MSIEASERLLAEADEAGGRSNELTRLSAAGHICPETFADAAHRRFLLGGSSASDLDPAADVQRSRLTFDDSLGEKPSGGFTANGHHTPPGCPQGQHDRNTTAAGVCVCVCPSHKCHTHSAD